MDDIVETFKLFMKDNLEFTGKRTDTVGVCKLWEMFNKYYTRTSQKSIMGRQTFDYFLLNMIEQNEYLNQTSRGTVTKINQHKLIPSAKKRECVS